jgi:ABC-type phosphate/phosphonate transport system permease subunit
MTAMPNSRPTLERWLALLVRYWAFNMTLVFNRGIGWPGFGYTDAEKTELKSISGKYSSIEYYAWLALVVVFALIIFLAVAIAGINCLEYAIGGEKNMANTPASLFFLSLALQLLVSLSLGFPLAMLPAAALVGRFFAVADQDLPDRPTTGHYFHKLWFQIARIAIVAVAVCVPMWVFVPSDSKFYVVLRLVIPMLSPAVAALTCAYFFIARVSPTESRGASPRR